MVKKVKLEQNERFSDLLLKIIENGENMSTRVYFHSDIKQELLRDWQGYGSGGGLEDMYAVSSYKGVVEVSCWRRQEMTKITRWSKPKTEIYIVSSVKLDEKIYPFSLPLPEYHTSKYLLVKRE